MSTAAPTIGRGPQGSVEGRSGVLLRAGNRGSDLLEWLASKAPIEDWITFGLLGIMLIGVGWSVQLAEWGDLPSIIPTLLLGWIAGFIAGRDRLPVMVNIAISAVIGFSIIMWQGSIPVESANIADRAREAWDRFWAWIVVAREGGISNDSVPFALMFMTASWITAYTVTSLTFRVRNPWAPIVLLAVGLMSNLSFRPGLHEHTFFIFIIASIALFAHLTAVRRMDRWRERGMNAPASLAWLSMFDGLVFGGIITLFVVLLPVIEPRSSTLDRAWEVLKAPIEALEDPANRLLSGVKAKDSSGGLKLPNDVLTFKGPIELTPEPLAWMTSRYATMLPGRVYDHYASTGWIATPELTRTVDAQQVMAPAPTDLGRERIEQLFQPLVPTNLVFPAGGVFEVDREAQVEYLRPASYRIPLTGPVGEFVSFPEDVRDFAFATRSRLLDIALRAPGAVDVTSNKIPLMSQQQVLDVLRNDLPPELEIRLRVNDDRLVTHMDVTRIGPEEQVGIVFTDVVEPERLYTVTTYVQTATDAQLEEAGDDYPGWVEDRYLSLPDTLPVVVRLLANQIVQHAGAETPWEKTQAIKRFLQSQVYSLEISGPAANQDGVFYFLFETPDEPCPTDFVACDSRLIKGYSQYYGSAATVLLRAAGVPSRMVAGWAAGEYIQEAGRFLIRDRDRHGWTQAYFAEYGWVDVEVTPGRVDPDRGLEYAIGPEANPEIGAGLPFTEDLFEEEDLSELEALARQFARDLALQGSEENTGFPARFVVTPIVIAVILLLLYGVWWFWHRGMTPAEQAYTKMVRFGGIMGLRRRKSQTPSEYATTIGDAMPGVADSAMLVALEFEKDRYAIAGRNGPAPGLPKHWRRVFRALIGYRVKFKAQPRSSRGEERAAY